MWTEPRTLRYVLPRDGGRPAAAQSARASNNGIRRRELRMVVWSFVQNQATKLRAASRRKFAQGVLRSVGWTVRQMVQDAWARDCRAPFARSELEGKSRSARTAREGRVAARAA